MRGHEGECEKGHVPFPGNIETLPQIVASTCRPGEGERRTATRPSGTDGGESTVGGSHVWVVKSEV